MGREPRRFETRHCTAGECGLRFPVDAGSSLGTTCPKCGARTEATGDAYTTEGALRPNVEPAMRLEALLDNVRSLRNVGSMFRTADGAGVAHLHLGGITPTPDHPKMVKTALGAESRVPWSHHTDAAARAAALAGEGHQLWALEGGTDSRSLFEQSLANDLDPARPLVLVMGHEVSGVDPRIVDVCERVVHIPMLGIKDSLNVSVAFGVAAYVLRFAASTT